LWLVANGEIYKFRELRDRLVALGHRFRTGSDSAALDREALHTYLMMGYVPAPLSMFEGVRKLPCATMLIAENGSVTERCYWRIPMTSIRCARKANGSMPCAPRLEESERMQMAPHDAASCQGDG
jgi:hypothetical protein